MTVATRPADAPVSSMVAALQDDGAVIVERVLRAVELANVLTVLDHLIGSAALGDNAFDGYRTRRIFDPLRRTRLLDEVVTHPVVHQVLEKVLDWPYQFGMTILSEIAPGEVAQRPHRDAAVYPLPTEFPEVMVNTIWAFDDFTDTNGATMVATGSHRDAARRVLEPATMAAGSVLIYSGRLLHGAGANISDTTRLGLIVEHVARWLRPAENHPVAIGADDAATLSPEIQELIGFNQTSEYFGFINGKPPRDWLAARSDR